MALTAPDATWNLQFFDNDEFKGTLTVTRPGTYSYAYRFSDDGGVSYMYGDFDPGTADGFSTTNLGTIVGIPYYFALDPSYDFTFNPLYMSEQGVLWQGEWRHRLANGESAEHQRAVRDRFVAWNADATLERAGFPSDQRAGGRVGSHGRTPDTGAR